MNDPRLNVIDNQNGSVNLAWVAFTIVVPDSYNVYLNGVLNQNVVGHLATVSGLAKESYANNVAVAPSGNSVRPQNMPPVGQVTASGTYTFAITAVKTGVEIAVISSTITLSPTSVMLVTPMKRLWPFPNSGLD